MKLARIKRLYHSFILLILRKPRRRTVYIKKHNIFGEFGENSIWGPWLIPVYPKLIKIHDNVRVHKTAKIVTHDLVNGFLKETRPDYDFGPRERIGCVELMDNVYIGMKVTIMPDVRINKNCMVSAGSVVSNDIPENSVAAGNPAKVVGRFDMFMALRRMSKSQHVDFKNQDLPDDLAEEQWVKFEKKRTQAREMATTK